MVSNARTSGKKPAPCSKMRVFGTKGSRLAAWSQRVMSYEHMLARYLQAWETDDVDGLVALLTEDATLSMPPVPSWYQGREAIRTILLAVLFPYGVQHRWRLSPTRANGQPAFVVYRAEEATRSYRAFAIQVVTLDASRRDLRQVAEVTAFLGPELVTSFGFPLLLPQ